MPPSGLGTAGIVAIPIPAGGAPGFVLTKVTADNYDFDWLAAGGGIAGITIEDEGAPLATLADTLNFVGAGVTASGAGTTKTITIPGGAGDLQAAYDADPIAPQIVIDATPNPVTFDASVAGDVFAVTDVAGGDLVRISTTGSEIFGGSNAGNLLTLQGSSAANRGRNIANGGITIDWDFTSDAVTGGAFLFQNTIPASGAIITSMITINNTIGVNAGTFIISALDDLSTLTWSVAPGFAVSTLFFARPTYQSTTVGIPPAQAFIYAAQAQYRLTGAGAVTTPNYRGLSFAPIVRVDNAGDDLSITNTIGITVGPLYNTRNATAVADFGTIRGVHMLNAATVFFGQALGSEIAANWIGIDVEALTGLTVSGVRAAVRSALPVSGTSNFVILNLSTAPSQFGAGGTHVNDNIPMQFGGTNWNLQDISLLWSTTLNAFQIFFASTADSIALSSPAANRFLMDFNAVAELNINCEDGFSIGAQTGANGNTFGNFVQGAFTVPIGGDFAGFLLTQGGNLSIGALALGRSSAWVINGLSYAAGTGSITNADTFTVGGMVTSSPGITITERQALHVIGGRSRFQSVMQYDPITPATLAAGNTQDYAGLLTATANNGMRHWARLAGDGAGTSALGGVDATGAQDGDTFKLTNVSANNVTLNDQDAGSVAANRIISPTGANYVLGPDESAEITYDLTTARWRILYGTGA